MLSFSNQLWDNILVLMLGSMKSNCKATDSSHEGSKNVHKLMMSLHDRIKVSSLLLKAKMKENVMVLEDLCHHITVRD